MTLLHNINWTSWIQFSEQFKVRYFALLAC